MLVDDVEVVVPARSTSSRFHSSRPPVGRPKEPRISPHSKRRRIQQRDRCVRAVARRPGANGPHFALTTSLTPAAPHHSCQGRWRASSCCCVCVGLSGSSRPPDLHRSRPGAPTSSTRDPRSIRHLHLPDGGRQRVPKILRCVTSTSTASIKPTCDGHHGDNGTGAMPCG
jgi:hypothetical protein